MRQGLAFLCLAWCLGLSVPATSAEPPARPARGLSSESRERFVAALGAFRSGDWNTAASEFGDRHWTGTPLQDYALLLQAQSLLAAGDGPGARRAALRAAGAVSDSRLAASAVVQAAIMLSRTGDDAGAATLFRRFLARHGDHPDAARARLGLAQALLADGRTAEASRAFTELWILAPASPEADAAAQQLRVLADRGLLGPPVTVRERVDRAERLLAAGRGDSARSEAEGLLGDGLPAELRARALKVVFEVARRAGQYDTAVATVNRALSDLPSDQRSRWLLELARLQKRRSRELAVGTLDRLIREHPASAESAEAMLMKGGLLEEAAKGPEARGAYQELAATRSDRAETAAALWRLGWLAWFRSAYAEAAQTWTRILTMRAGQPLREAVTYWLGRAEEQRGEPAPAARRFAQLEAEAPRSYYGILAARRNGGEAKEVRSSASPVPLPGDPVDLLQADPDYLRVDALRAVGLGDFADEEMAEMTRRASGEPRFLYALSAAYAQESRYHLALRILRRHFQSIARAGELTAPRAFWEMYYPMGWRSELTEAAGRAVIDPLLVAAVVREESSFYPRARSRVGARGLMQLMPETARSLAQTRRLPFGGGDALDDPGANLELGAGYLAQLLREFGDARLAAAAYNAGPTRVREWWGARRSDDLEVWVEQIPYDETRAFVKRVMLSWEEYRRLYAMPPAAESTGPDDGSSGR